MNIITKRLLKLSEALSSRGLELEAGMASKLASPDENRINIVREGTRDGTLGGIADQYNTLIDKLLEANPQLTTDSILGLGDEVIIPPPLMTPNADHPFPSPELADWMRTEEGGSGGHEDMCGNTPAAGEPFLCSYDDGFGNFTIGYGRNQNYQRKQIITREQVEEFFEEDLDEAASHLRSSIAEQSDRALQVPFSLMTNQLDALTSIIFNAGLTGYRTSTLHRDFISKGINSGADFESAFKSAAVGSDQGGLDGRRERELSMFKDGQYIKKY